MKKFFRFILLIVNVLFAAAMLLSTLSGTFAPSRFAAVSILSYGYFVLLLCNVLFIIIWLCMGRWEFLVSVAAIALRFSFVPLFFQVGGTAEADNSDDGLRVMTFNTHGFSGLDSDTVMTRDSGAVLFLRLLDAEQPDVLCLQEFFIPPRMRLADSLAARGFRYHYGVHAANLASPAIIFSRYPFARVQDMDRKSKFCVDIAKGGQEYRVCCVHLNSYQLTEDDIEGFEKLSHAQPDSTTHRLLKKFVTTTRQHECEWKEELLPLVQKSQVPLIIAGDFNDTPASYIYQKAAELLSDPYVEQGRGFGTTYHGPFPAYRIDYILHSPDLAAVSYKRVRTDISDHYPIVVQLKIKD